MKIGVLGTGTVGQTIADKLVELGHEVKMGSRSAGNEKAKAWAAKHQKGASEGSFADAAKFGSLIFICTKGEGTLEAAKAAGADNLSGKIVVDLTNPIDSGKGMPPGLFTDSYTSLGELLQQQFPDAKVVKTFNTMWCGLMVNPRLIQEDHNVFIGGNDGEAKAKVKELLKSFGWRDSEIMDLGDITTSRGTEMYLPLWLRMFMAQGQNGAFNVRVVKAG